jgi:uncharacterized membrane protein YeaQ/YmgE (transglycosylase-associated protein family)
MDIIITGLVAGVLGTLMMDSLNHLFARIGMISKIDVGVIGRMSAGWARGYFRYRNPAEMVPVAKEKLYGYATHHIIGIGFAVVYVFCWEHMVGGPVSPTWALVYGVFTTLASWFLVYPSMGLGVFGRLSPEGIRTTLSSLANHLFFGVGMAVSIVLF